jgi:excisionase family DNA binding protein
VDGSEAADELAVAERFIRELIADGDLRAVKVGTRVVRIRRTDLDDLLQPARVVPRLGRR